jgi:hypothetical protein
MAGDAKSEKKEKGFVAHLFTWVAVMFWSCFLLVGIYVLSFGPIGLLTLKGSIGTGAFDVMSPPLERACRHSKFADRFLHWYLNFVWGIETPGWPQR